MSSHIHKIGRYRGNAIINPIMIHNCIRCRTKLIPIVYDRVDPEYIALMAKGLIIISLEKDRKFNSFCPLCEERYVDITDTPHYSSNED